MSLQKGKGFRRFQPWTASNDWIFDSKPPAYLKPFGVVVWQGIPVICQFDSISEKYTFDYHSSQIQWVGSINLPFVNFLFRVRIQPRIVNPNNVVNLLLTDELGGSADVTWSLPPDSFEWTFSGFAITEPILLQKYAGGFSQVQYWGFGAATYAERP